MQKKFLLAPCALALVAVGCSMNSPTYDKAQASATQITENSTSILKEEFQPTKTSIGEVFNEAKVLDVDDYTLVIEDKRTLPRSFKNLISIKSDENGMPITELSSLIYVSENIIVDTSSDDLFFGNGVNPQNNKDSVVGSTSGVQADSTGFIEPTQTPSFGQPDGKEEKEQKLTLKPFKFSGSVQQLFDYVSAYNNIKWRYDAKRNKVFFYRYAISEFSVYDFASESKDSVVITNESKAQAKDNSGGSKQSKEFTYDLDPWGSIKDAVTTMLSKNGRASFDKSTGMIVARDNDYTLSQIGNYVDRINEISTKKVNVIFRMVTVSITENIYKSLNVSSLNEKLTNKVFGSFDLDAGFGQLSPNLNNNRGTLQELAKGNYLSFANDSFGALIGMLDEIGTTKVSGEQYFEFTNNSGQYYQKARSKEFISSIEKSSPSDSSGRENLTTKKDDAVDGFNIALKGRIIDDRILVDYNVALTSSGGLEDAGLGNGLEGIKLKSEGSQNFNQKTTLLNGETRIAFISSDEEEITDKSAPVDRSLWILGGKESVATRRNVTFITVTSYYNN
ncbi:MAG: hypothetical protein HAW67_03775 [Endozoicomonadaceae bacterium]|nr:hypothetical protein [Endozoicomonadaceae bacterium]